MDIEYNKYYKNSRKVDNLVVELGLPSYHDDTALSNLSR